MLSIGSNIRKTRELHQLTQKDLAEMIGKSTQQISRWETDGVLPSIETLTNISEKLAIDIRDLISPMTMENNLDQPERRKAVELRMLIEELKDFSPIEQLELLLRIRKEREAQKQ